MLAIHWQTVCVQAGVFVNFVSCIATLASQSLLAVAHQRTGRRRHRPRLHHRWLHALVSLHEL
jgi:hypothetical protein